MKSHFTLVMLKVMKRLLSHLRNSETGLTLMELIIALVLIGLIFPTFFSLAGMASVRATRFIHQQEAQYLAESKLEEIIGYKRLNWDWYKYISDFEGSESLSDGYERSVNVTKINRWGKAEIKGWQVTVSVTHPALDNPVSLTVRFSQYYEIKE